MTGSGAVPANRTGPDKRALLAVALIVTALFVIGSLVFFGSRGIPWGWKVSRDVTGACEAATPADWKMGREFFLKREKAETDPKGRKPGRFPPSGLALWGIERRDHKEFPQLRQGKRFQMRTSVVLGDGVCSVWRVKQAADFTEIEKDTMKQIGKTLRWVQ